MAVTLYNQYEQVLRNNDWKYYPFQDTLSMDILSNSEDIKTFLMTYLGKGEKNNLEIFNYLNGLPLIRLQHTLSCFILGILLYQKSCSISFSIKDELRRIPISNPETIDERFKYLWMLISVFHDFGYAIENNEVSLSKKEFEQMISNLQPRPKTIPNIYTKKLLRNYSKYRLCRFGSEDHGICGGIKLYSDLCELRKEKENQITAECYWGDDLIPSYALAAWTIACHNIWMIEDCEKNDDTIMCYKHMNLSKLIYKTQSRTIKESPFLFLLCLVDSIDPIKIFKNLDILNHMAIDFSKAGSIEIQTDGLCQPKKNDYMNRILGLNNWLIDVDDTTITL